MKPLTITIATGPFYPTPPAPTGAVQRIWYDLSLRLAARGHKVTVLACRYPGQARDEHVQGVEIHRRTGLTQGRNVYVDILKDSWYSSRAAMMLPRGDIVVTNAFWAPVFAKLRQGSRGRTVVHVATAPKGQLFLYKGVARLDTPSEAMKSMILAQAPWAAGRVTVSPNPIDVAVFCPPSRPREWTSVRTRTLAYTGRVHPTKGCEALVRAYVQLRKTLPRETGENLRLRLIGAQRVDQGGGGEDYVRRLHELAEGHPVAIDEPIFDRGGLARALQEADYYCYPSMVKEGEAFGVAPLEAMATGLVPVVSDMPAFTQFMKHGVHGLVFDHKAADPVPGLARALETLVRDPELTARMSAECVRTSQEFSYDAVADRHVRHFRELLEGKDAEGRSAGGQA